MKIDIEDIAAFIFVQDEHFGHIETPDLSWLKDNFDEMGFLKIEYETIAKNVIEHIKSGKVKTLEDLAIVLLYEGECWDAGDKRDSEMKFFTKFFLDAKAQTIHDGDCIRKPYSCSLCIYEEQMLKAKNLTLYLKEILKD